MYVTVYTAKILALTSVSTDTELYRQRDSHTLNEV